MKRPGLRRVSAFSGRFLPGACTEAVKSPGDILCESPRIATIGKDA